MASPAILCAQQPVSENLLMRLLAKIVVPVLLAASTPQPTLRFCDLVRNPAEYNGKTVTVRATYRYGFEWEELYCLDCLDKGKAWLEVPSDLDDASSRP
jgi:hypothetical protein